jgi:hypothetical protein
VLLDTALDGPQNGALGAAGDHVSLVGPSVIVMSRAG